VVVETWPSGLNRLYATRVFVLRDREERVLARGTSAWLVIDTERRRPVRPPASLDDLELPDRPSPIDDEGPDPEAPERVDAERTFRVRYHDLDLNRHVNNVRYLEWALETLPLDVLDEHTCRSVALKFEAETNHGDPVRATADLSETDDGLRARHRLAHAETDRTLAHAATAWREAAAPDP
jgi:acyl-ACP thioesterase